MENKKISESTILELHQLLKSGEITPVELADFYLQKSAKLNPEINAYVTITKDEALRVAEKSKQRYQAGKSLGVLDGIPIALKDNLSTDGIRTTASSKILENYIPPYNATVVQKLKDKGAIFLGKTNLDEFAMGSSTETSYFKVTKNPYDVTRVPGGSSGGSAAAVAADMAVAALGSDTGGSIRQPASFCGVVGFKPTYGAVSRYGLLAMASSLDQIGPLAKTVEDAEILFEAISGKDAQDATSIDISRSQKKIEIKNLKLGIPKEYFEEGLDLKVKEVVRNSIEKLKKMGAQITEVSLPSLKHGFSCYYIIMPVEVSSNLARYDGIKYGLSAVNNPQAEIHNLLDVYLKSRLIGFGDEAKRRILLGAYTSSAGYIGKFYHKAEKVRALIKAEFDEAFSKVDYIVGPVTPEVAFKIGQKSDPLTMYLSDIYTLSANLAGLPAISVPAGLAQNLPVGLQIIGPQKSDWEILNLAKIFEKERGALPSPQLS